MISTKYFCPKCKSPMWKHAKVFSKRLNKEYLRYKCSNCECKSTLREMTLEKHAGIVKYCQTCHQVIDEDAQIKNWHIS